MERAAVSTSAPAAVAFTDGLGERRQVPDPTGAEMLEVLCLREELAAVPSFEFALRERVSRLAAFRHAYFGRIRSVERLTDRHATLALVSDCTAGVRLSDLLTRATDRRVNFDINTALCLLRQLVPAVATLHEIGRDIPGLAHGAIGPERLVVTPNARLVIVEYAMGAALEQLRFSQERYWQELRVAVPRTAGLPRFDQRVDVTQIGIVALSLILGRLLRDDEYPSRIGDVVASTWAISARGGFEPLPPGLRSWLGRALQIDARTAFTSAADARAELDKVLGDSDYMASPASLEAFLAKYHAAERPASAAFPPVDAAKPPAPIAVMSPGLDEAFEKFVSEIPAAPVPNPPPLVQPVAAKPQPAAPPPVPRRSFEIHEPPAVEAHEEPPSRIGGTSRSRFSGWSMKVVVAAGALVALIVGGFAFGRGYFTATESAAATGTLGISSNPPGAQVLVDGETRGITPLTVTLAPGAHMVELRGGGEPRSIPVMITAGTESSQYIELPQSGPSVGQLQVRSEPPGARVTVDGTPRGIAPIVVGDLLPGEHTVVLEGDLGSVKEVVTIESGVTASLVVPLTGAQGAPVPGWISVSAPVDIQMYEDGRLLGTNLSDRIMVPAGRHEIEFVNDALGYRFSRTVQVAAGRVATVTVEVPRGTIALNALPWAEVWIDGERIGETPIGNHTLPIGPHAVLFRHPEFGEQHHTVMVTLKGAARLSVDMRKK
jgi:hypothetical protein